MKGNIIAGLDIGSTAVRLVVGQKTANEAGEQLQILGAVTVPAEGINRGVVNSIEDATSAISACLEKAERLIGVPLANVWVGINGPNLKCEKSRGVVAVGRSDNEITEDDVNRAIEAAQALSVPPNYEILHVIPVKFSVDNQEDIKDPIGMTGVRLEVETLIIQGFSTQIKNLTKAIYHTGLEINDLVLSPLAAAEVVIAPKQKELGAALINIGSATASLAVFEEGELLHAAVIPIGSEHITADVAIGLRCPINLAERIKLEYGSSVSQQFTKKDEVDISELLKEENVSEESMVISKKYVAEIIEARVEEIFDKIDNELKKIDRSGMLPAGVFLIGGGAKLNDIVETAKNRLRLPACLGVNKNIMLAIDKVNDINYLTALGLAVWGNQLTGRGKKGAKLNWPGGGLAGKGLEKIKDWFKSLIP
ncbi:MAG: Cell division protein ftsA [Parcubacteria group bacterium GW2011_GWC2_42_12]|uniref:Cell division protein FtsA n=2 Tax=Candidatus Falkowiibacteriota TaxID=1752728 RepID=A0A1F5S8Z9_9BACT|nr:MAG: Cell division protein ftsA [Candidatus Falkowbacteria bacterium GW2011_GWA2_41_14]KKS35358.1 MAG: Cell division protein ftsA [Parcubacteria group bacterium GW2011_GWC2_42_12]OGF23129.1 MAG: cell division protein FtsA [Candidatus Falkowbacteria bacterium RIFCSPHIGHO2_02_FULL_42_9]